MSKIEHADFTPSAPNFKQLVLMNFQGLTNFPYIEEDFDALNNYGLLSKVVEYLNQVIANNNEQNDLMTGLYNAYVSLQNYVNDYFDNLDVQDEINNKLDEMAQNGSLTLLIKQYIDPIQEEFENQINSQITIQNNTINQINTKVNNAVSGSPLVVSSTSAMTDTTRVYVNTTDGNWYYYDGDSWEIGGVYQSTGIDHGEIYPKNFSDKLLENLQYRIPEYTLIANAFRRNTGLIATEQNNYTYSSPFEVHKGEIVYVRGAGYLDRVMMIAQVDEDNTYKGDMQYVLSIDSTRNEYFLVANNNCYMSISYNTTIDMDVYIFKNEDNKKITEIMNFINMKIAEPLVVWNHYINNTSINSQRGLLYTEPIQLNGGETIKFSGRGYATNVNLLSKVESDGTVIEPIRKSTDSSLVTVEYTAPTDMYVAISCTSSSLSTIIIYKKDVEDVQNKYQMFTAFNKFGVIGDSLSSGEIAYWDGTQNVYVDNIDNSWGQYMARRYGLECINFSRGGLNTRSWLTDSEGLPKLIASGNLCKAYIIGLGVNDANKLGAGYLGTSNDINLADYTQNADTYYGNYGRIIGNIKAIQPNAKIFLLTIPDTGSQYTIFNNAVRTIANMFDNVYLIDLYTLYLSYFTTGFIHDNLRAGHYNAIAYNYMATLLYDWICDFMYNSYTEFKQIDLIPVE